MVFLPRGRIDDANPGVVKRGMAGIKAAAIGAHLGNTVALDAVEYGDAIVHGASMTNQRIGDGLGVAIGHVPPGGPGGCDDGDVFDAFKLPETGGAVVGQLGSGKGCRRRCLAVAAVLQHESGSG